MKNIFDPGAPVDKVTCQFTETNQLSQAIRLIHHNILTISRKTRKYDMHSMNDIIVQPQYFGINVEDIAGA